MKKLFSNIPILYTIVPFFAFILSLNFYFYDPVISPFFNIITYLVSVLIILHIISETKKKIHSSIDESILNYHNSPGKLILNKKGIIEKADVISKKIFKNKNIEGLKIQKLLPSITKKQITANESAKFFDFDNDINIELFFIKSTEDKITCLIYNKTPLIKMYETLNLEKKFSDAIIDQNPEAIVVFNPDMTIIRANKQVENLINIKAEDLINKKCYKIINDKNTICNTCKIPELLSSKKPQRIFKHEILPGGKENWIHQSWYPILNQEQEVIYIVEVARDITELNLTKKALIESEDKFKQFAEISPSFILILQNLNINYANRYAQNFISIDETNVNENNFLDFVDKEFKEIVQQNCIAIEKENSQTCRMELKIITKSGIKKWMDFSAGPIDFQDKKACLCIAFDITDQKILEESLKQQNLFDSLTKLPNLILFKDRVSQAIKLQQTNDKLKFSIIYFNIDRFKSINNSFGFITGDTILQIITEKISLLLNPTDSFARIAADEFAILIDEFISKKDIEILAKKIHDIFTSPIKLTNEEIYVSLSIGVLFGNNSYKTTDEVLQNANTAMFHSKLNGGNSICYYKATLDKTPYSYLKFENEIRSALKKNQFVNFYQPIVNLSDGSIKGFETLIRWKPNENEIIHPDQFISISENSKLIIPIGYLVMDNAFKQLLEWNKFYNKTFTLSINVSPVQFNQPDFVSELNKRLAEFPCSEFIDLEITENVLMENVSSSIEKLNELKKRNISFSIDDFGTGYSSLSYLQQFPVETIKIDKSFILDIDTNKSNEQIVKAIISLAHNLKLKVIAEGVEKKEQLDILKKFKCDFIQGFYFSPPVPAEKIEMILKSKKPFKI